MCEIKAIQAPCGAIVEVNRVQVARFVGVGRAPMINASTFVDHLTFNRACTCKAHQDARKAYAQNKGK